MSKSGRSQRAGRWAQQALWLAAPAVLGGSACAQIIGLEEWNGGSTSGSSSAGTGGGAASSASSASSTGGGAASSSASASSSSSGAGGGCLCGMSTECQSFTCMNNMCVEVNVAPGTLSPQDTQGDCVDRVCDGMGAVTLTPNANDVPPPPSACLYYMCTGPTMPKLYQKFPGSPCDMNSSCNGTGQCQPCAAGPPLCADGCTDGMESDTDCGQVCGIPKLCGNGKHCGTEADCMSGKCNVDICAP